MKSFQAKPLEVERKWYLVDAKGKTVGRLAARVASILRGKHKPTFTPNVDTGDHVVIINAGHVQFTRDKFKTKTYYQHSGFPGGLKAISAEHLHAKKTDGSPLEGHQGHAPQMSARQSNGQETENIP